YSGILNEIGLQLAATQPNKNKAFIGADLTETDGKLTVRSVASNTPAYEQGLNSGDQIVAVDGYRATQAFLQSYIGERKPGDNVRLTIFRFDKMRDIKFTLASNEFSEYRFSRVAEPSDEQKKLYHGYLN